MGGQEAGGLPQGCGLVGGRRHPALAKPSQKKVWVQDQYTKRGECVPSELQAAPPGAPQGRGGKGAWWGVARVGRVKGGRAVLAPVVNQAAPFETQGGRWANKARKGAATFVGVLCRGSCPVPGRRVQSGARAAPRAHRHQGQEEGNMGVLILTRSRGAVLKPIWGRGPQFLRRQHSPDCQHLGQPADREREEHLEKREGGDLGVCVSRGKDTLNTPGHRRHKEEKDDGSA